MQLKTNTTIIKKRHYVLHIHTCIVSNTNNT